MAILNKARRDKMPSKEFALPGKHFPLNDKVHDRMAISGATRSEHAGNISSATADRIKSEARAKLGIKKMAEGGKVSLDPHSHSAGHMNRGRTVASVSESWACPRG